MLQRVREVHGVMDGGVVELHVDGVVLFVVVAAHDTHRVPNLRTHATVLTSQLTLETPYKIIIIKKKSTYTAPRRKRVVAIETMTHERVDINP